MIRFNCPHCDRLTEVPDALAKLPLVCKQCGQRIVPASVAPAPAPPPPAPAAPQAAPIPAKPTIAPPVAKPVVPAPKPSHATPQAAPDDDDVLVAKPDSTPDIDFNIGGPTATSLSDAARQRPAGLSDATRTRPTELDSTPIPGSDTPQAADSEPEINLDLLPRAAPPPKTQPKPKPEPEPEPAPEPKPEPAFLPFLADLGVFLLLLVVGLFLGELLAGKSTGQVVSEMAGPKFPSVELLLWAAPPLVFGLAYLLLNSRERTLGAWLRRRNQRA